MSDRWHLEAIAARYERRAMRSMVRSVSSQGVDSDDGLGEKHETDESSNGPTDRPIRARKPSQWLAGPDWTR